MSEAMQADRSSKYIGVRWSEGKWRATAAACYAVGISTSIPAGMHESPEKAASVRDRIAILLRGQ